MNYPIWDVAFTGGGFLIALVAIFHVFVAHFAVGGGIFLVVTERKSHKDGDTRIYDYVAGHTKFFLLTTLVAGAVTGAGIWLTISAIHPGATSVLIHTFVFGWATEWVFFVVEIISLFVYYYTFHKMNHKDHMVVGWIYAGAAWASLVIIGGIIAFMLTPGGWLEDKSFWSAFFNPSFIPSVVFRTAIALMLAGVYGILTSTWIKDPEFKQKMMRYCIWWVALPFVLLVPSGWWYLESIPAEAKAMILGGSKDVVRFSVYFLWLAPIILVGALVLAAKAPRWQQRTAAVILMALSLAFMGSFEYMRETGRRPWIIHNYMYSTGILKSDLEKTRQKGVLAAAKWSGIKNVTLDNQARAGRQVFTLLCMSCHSVGGLRNDIRVQIAGMDAWALKRLVDTIGGPKTAFMPPFAGNKQEKDALLTWLAQGAPR